MRRSVRPSIIRSGWDTACRSSGSDEERRFVGMWSLHSSVSWLGFYSGLFGLLVAALGFLGISRAPSL